jgi:hypothetical protein
MLQSPKRLASRTSIPPRPLTLMYCCSLPLSICAFNLPKLFANCFLDDYCVRGHGTTCEPIGRGGGVIISVGGGALDRSLPCFNHYLQTLLSITRHGPTCPNRRMRPNSIKILLMWPLGPAPTTTILVLSLSIYHLLSIVWKTRS